MPFEFRTIIKFCKECGIQLTLKNSRDIARKNFCSHSCRAKYFECHKNGDVKTMSTPEANAKKSRPGSLNGRWLKDRSAVKTRSAYEGANWKRSVMERDNFTCQECGQVGGKLHVHHKAPYKLFSWLRWDSCNGLTVCEKCHKDIHSASTELFGAISSQKASYVHV